MPPKKNVDNISAPSSKTKEKAPRKKTPKIIPEKPTAPVAKSKLPSIKSFPEKKSPPKPRKKRNVSPELSAKAKRKIELANEVALAQLKKPDAEKLKPQLEIVINKETVKITPLNRDSLVKEVEKPNNTKVVKKKGRPKKQVLQTEPEKSCESLVVLNVPKPKKAIPKKPPYKRTKKNTENLALETSDTGTSKRKADSTSTPITSTPIVAPNKIVKRRNVRNKVVKENKKTEIKPVTPTIQDKRPVKKRGKKNDAAILNTNKSQSPSLLTQADKTMNGSELVTAEPKISNPCPVDSRKTSTSECPSWIKDISSSSTGHTCLTVTSNIVVLDKKLPVIKLQQWKKTDDDKIQTDDSDSESSSSNSSSSSTSSSEQESRQSPSRSLKLSTSSVTPAKSVHHTNSVRSSITQDEDWEYALKKLAANLQKIDLEAIKWIGYENQNINEAVDISKDKIFKLLKFECDVLKDCENIGKNFKAKKDSERNHSIEKGDKAIVTNIEPNSYSSKSEDDGNFTTSQGKYVMFDQTCADEEDPLQEPQVCYNKGSEEDNFSPEKSNYVPLNDNYNNDDDDALSLFAESITGIEPRIASSANSICANASEYEEYVPQPMISTQQNYQTNYVPTRIRDVESPSNLKNKTVCEKQNADSTSIYKENDSQSATLNETTKESPALVANRTTPKLISQIYHPMSGIKSTVFRGVCFFSLVANCKRIRCIFPHEYLEIPEIQNRLTKLSDDMFIQEYMLLRSWPDLRRMYGNCYVVECIRRKLTRVLVEMAIDFISKAKLDSVDDSEISINVTERVLMYLNDVDLDVCDDLLRYDLGKGILLCDVLMQAIGETQNFSRFKKVFIKLTDFMSNFGGKFQLKVAKQIFERVCILPTEEPIALAVLIIIQHTDPKIFDNPMMSKFEKQARELNLYDKFLNLKEHANTKLSQTSNESFRSPRIGQEMDHNNLSLMYEREERYTSPDTTKMDNSNKPPDDATPAVQIIGPVFNHLFKPNHGAQETPRLARPWRGSHHQAHYTHMNNQGMCIGSRFSRPMMRPSMRPRLKRPADRNVVYGCLPPKFPRRPPNFF